MTQPAPRPQQDFYVEHGRVVFTAQYLLRRGACCGNGCRHCPYESEPSALAAGNPTTDAAPASPTSFC